MENENQVKKEEKLKYLSAYNTNKHPITYAETYAEHDITVSSDFGQNILRSTYLLDEKIIDVVKDREPVVLGNKLGNEIVVKVRVCSDLCLPCSIGRQYDDIKGLPPVEFLNHIDVIFGNFITAPEINRANGKRVIGPDTMNSAIKDGNKLLGVSAFIMYPAFDFDNKGDNNNWLDTIIDPSDVKRYNDSFLVVSAPTFMFYDDNDKCFDLSKLKDSFLFEKDSQVSIVSSYSSKPKMERIVLKVDNMPDPIEVNVNVYDNYDLVKNVPPVYAFVGFGISDSPTINVPDKVVLVPEIVALTIDKYRPDLKKRLCIISGNGNECAVRDSKGSLIGFKSFKIWSDLDRFSKMIEKVGNNNNNNNNNDKL